MKPFIPSLLFFMLTACAMTSSVREDSEDLVKTKGYAAAVEYLEMKVQKRPNDTEAKALLERYRWHWNLQTQVAADQAMARGDTDQARALYSELLRRDPANARAQEGLEAIERGRTHAQWLLEAQDALAKGATEIALAQVNRILAEDPDDAAATSVKRQIDEQRNRENMTSRKLKTAFKKRITLEFRDQNLRNIFEVISRTANVNFIFDRDVPPDLRTTIFARNTTVDDAIRVLLATNKLERKLLNENTLMIYPATPDKLRDNQELITKAFYVTNADISKTMNMIKLMVKTNDVYVDERLNMIVMRDTPEAIRVAEKLIAAHDIPDPEVTLELQVMEVSSDHVHDIGVNLLNTLTFGYQSTRSTGSSGGDDGEGTPVSSSNTLTLADFVRVSRNNITVAGLNPFATLKLQESDGATRILANPKIRIRNREKAKILIGEKVPIFTTATTNNVTSSSVQYQDVGLTVRAEPTIHADNNVSVKLYLEVSKLGAEVTAGDASGAKAYRIDSRIAETVLRLKNGETQMLAGLIRNEDRSTYARVPGVGDIPLLGRLFGETRKTKDSTEIVLLVTPHVVRSLNRPTANITEFQSGTAAQITDQPLFLDSTDNLSDRGAQPGEFPVPTPSQNPNPAPAPVPVPAPAPAAAPNAAPAAAPQAPKQ